METIDALVIGGGVTGLCAKHTNTLSATSLNPLDALICPDCLTKTQAEHSVRPFVGGLCCAICDASFPQVDGVYFLLPTELFRALYPEIAARH